MHQIFEDPKIVKLIFLNCKEKKEISKIYSALNKKISSVLQSAPFKSEWIIKNSHHQLDLWLQAFLKKVNLESSNYQDWIANQVYRTKSKPQFIENFVNDQHCVTRLISHYKFSSDRLKGLWVYLLVNRSLLGISLVLEDAIFFQTLLNTPWLLRFCIFACIFTPSAEDSEKGLAVLKFILQHSESMLSPLVLQEALALACQLDLPGHVETLSPICPEEKRACLWIEIVANPSANANSKQILDALAADISGNLHKLLDRAKALLDEDDSALKYLKFEQLVMENSSKWFGQTLREIWCVLNETCLRNSDVLGVQRFASFYSQDEHLILPLSQFALAVLKGLDEACEELLPLVDCVIPGKGTPTMQDRLSILFTEYCKTPKKVLFSQLNILPSFSFSLMAKSKKIVIEHQLAVISFLYRSLKKTDPLYRIQSTDVWESIQAENTELSALLQNWGASPSWMEASDNNVKQKTAGTGKLQPESSFTKSDSDEESDADQQSGMFMAFDGEKSSFQATKRLSKSYVATIEPTQSYSTDSDTRVNIFATDKKAGQVCTLLGARRINHQSQLLAVAPVAEENSGTAQKGGRARASTFMGQYNQQSNHIWDVYFKADLKKLQKLMSETSLTNFDWMEVQDKSQGRKNLRLVSSGTSNDGIFGSLEDQALLKKYTQLF